MSTKEKTKDLQTEFDSLDNPRKRAFLTKYADAGTISEATRLVDVSRRTFYTWHEKDETFALLFDEAKEAFADKLELELYSRAMTSTDKMSTIALFFALKGLRPDKYREKQATPMVVGNVTIKMDMPDELPQIVEAPSRLIEIKSPHQGTAVKE